MAITQPAPGELLERNTALVQSMPANPVVECRADPWVINEGEMCYFTASYPDFDKIVIRGAATIDDLRDAPEVVVWTRPTVGDMGGNIWAPELHRLNGRWYVYYTAGHADKPFRIRMYVIEGIGDDPRTAQWSQPRRIHSTWDEFSLDGTVFQHQGELYYVWAQRPLQPEETPEEQVINSDLYIARMTDPFTLGSEPVLLTTPELPWEIIGYRVNEGAAVIVRHGRVFITYSASATDHNYCMGLLWADANADLLDPQSWHKAQEPVFTSHDATSSYGPGHNSFTIDAQGNDVMVYHARSYRDIDGNPLFDPNRHARVQHVYWDANGFPQFGVPVGDGVVPVRCVGPSGTVLSAAPQGGGQPSLAPLMVEESLSDAATIASTQFRVVHSDDVRIVLEPLEHAGVHLDTTWSEIDALLGGGARFTP
ncbi:glycoside hydrolase family 43 protein [Jonesia quinghaiensis]|uniref:glycoside hydrolase family 43 protein n=1 Tax=Jonesia quinghaiensis TaxID=262806 RepID=UPI0004287A57|nr:family 43 glycosylhydrolase [Jonesia quinghaiensis]